ncbi:hypothetical protein BDR06DRAFT_1027887 [Suillus hirtellus]|nr:hypothetical protein BDR06DRAFT_1027887 [Suillus hirtellus]
MIILLKRTTYLGSRSDDIKAETICVPHRGDTIKLNKNIILKHVNNRGRHQGTIINKSFLPFLVILAIAQHNLSPRWAGDPSCPSPLSPGPLQCQFHQGAYMQDNQALHECCKALELREIQLTTECDTIKLMFEHLASAVQLSKPDSFKLHDLKAIILTSPGSSHPTCKQYPKIWFWSQDNFISWLDTASSQTTDCRKIPYLKDENGDPVPENTVKAICKLLQGGWSELLNQKIAPQSLGEGNCFCETAYTHADGRHIPIFKFADDGWKLDYLTTTSYPSWCHNNLDNSVKKEDDDDNDNNDTNSNEQTALPVPVVDVPVPVPSLIITQTDSEKENTPSSPNLNSADTTEPIKNTIGPLATTENTTKPLVNTNNTTKPLPNTENTTKPLVDTKNTAKPLIDLDETVITVLSNASSKPQSTPASKPLRITLPNPLSVLALAAAKVNIPPSPPAELDKEKPSKTSSKGKMCPSPKHNGQNLCAHHWLKQIKTNGTMDEFCVYYGSLNKEQRKEYDNKVNTLVSNMVSVSIYSD